jgi:NAD-dependent deacetylase
MAKQKLVVLTGAGISAESGLRTFRDSDGLWEGYRIEDVATPRAWRRDPALVLDFYNMRRRDVLAAQPNAAHKALAALQEYFDVQIITQNIDDLHERAGSVNVMHLHGEILKMRSERNRYTLYPITVDMVPGQLADDGSMYRPHVVWFEEPVPMIEEAIPHMAEADVFILIGTSLAVYPAAGLVDYVPDEVVKYVVDKRMPSVSSYSNVVPIEQPATAGMAYLLQLLAGK